MVNDLGRAAPPKSLIVNDLRKISSAYVYYKDMKKLHINIFFACSLAPFWHTYTYNNEEGN